MQKKVMKDEKGRWEISMPYPLFDHIRDMYGIKTDRHLAQILGISHPLLSRIRHRVIRITPIVILAVHEQTSIPVARIKELSK